MSPWFRWSRFRDAAVVTLAVTAIVGFALPAAGRAGADERLRIIVETDGGGDPDDEQSLVRFLLYADEPQVARYRRVIVQVSDKINAVNVPRNFVPRTRLSVKEGRWLINGELTCPDSRAEGLLMNVRMVNAVFEDTTRPDFDAEANTDEFIARIPDYVTHGVRAFTVGLQGGMPGYEGAVNSAFEPDGALRKSYLARVQRVIEACDHPIIKSPDGEIALIRLAKRAALDLPVSTSGIEDGRIDERVAAACDFLLFHFNGVKTDDISGRIAAGAKFRKPIVCNEDDKRGEEAARAAEQSVDGGVSWGLMLERQNQHFPFTFRGAADDPVVYAKLRRLTSPYPTKSWCRGTAAEFGMDAGGLEAFREFVGGRGCVVRDGTMIFTWGDQAQRGDVASACKAVYAHLLAKAVEDGKIESYDEPVRKWDPRLDELNPGLDFKDRRITWRHLINQTSCYGVREPPGEAYDYSDFNMAFLFDTLLLKVYATTYTRVDDEVLRPKLTDLLDCEDEPTSMAFGTDNRPGRLGMSVRDMARFGLLYLHHGHWKNRAILAERLAVQLVTSPLPLDLPRTKGEKADMLTGQRSIGGGNNQTDHFGSYSFAWWTNGTDREGKRHWPAAPSDTFAALGHGGQRALIVIPSLDLVVSWNDAAVDGRERQNRALELLRQAFVVQENPTNADPSVRKSY